MSSVITNSLRAAKLKPYGQNYPRAGVSSNCRSRDSGAYRILLSGSAVLLTHRNVVPDVDSFFRIYRKRPSVLRRRSMRRLLTAFGLARHPLSGTARRSCPHNSASVLLIPHTACRARCAHRRPRLKISHLPAQPFSLPPGARAMRPQCSLV